jgi:hypothetical protein
VDEWGRWCNFLSLPPPNSHLTQLRYTHRSTHLLLLLAGFGFARNKTNPHSPRPFLTIIMTWN